LSSAAAAEAMAASHLRMCGDVDSAGAVTAQVPVPAESGYPIAELEQA
jgi:hypothetical protein